MTQAQEVSMYKNKTRHNFLLVLWMTFCIIIMTGCVRFSSTIDVKPNGKADLSFFVAESTEIEDDVEEISISPKTKSEFINDGWTVTDYSEDDYIGYTVSKKDLDLSTVLEFLNTNLGENTYFTLEKTGNKYVLDGQIKNKAYSSDFGSLSSYIVETGGYMDFSINLPVKAGENNATSVSADGKTLTWNLLTESEFNNIHVEFSLPMFSVLLIILFAAILIIGLVIIWRRTKQGTNQQ